MNRTWMCTVTALLLTLTLCPKIYAAGSAQLNVPQADTVGGGRIVRYLGSTIAYPITEESDLRALVATLAAVTDLTEPAPGPAGAVSLETKIILEQKDGGSVTFVLSADSLRREGDANPRTVSKSLGPLRALADKLTARYTPTVEPFLVGSASTSPQDARQLLEAEPLHLYNNADKTYTQPSAAQEQAILQRLAALRGSARDASQESLGALLSAPSSMAVYDGEVKVSYFFYENGLRIETSARQYVNRDGTFAREELNIAPQCLTFSKDGYAALLRQVQAAYSGAPKGAHWLGMMRENRTKEDTDNAPMLFHTTSRNSEREAYTYLPAVFEDLKALRVIPASYREVTGKAAVAQPVLLLDLRFSGGIVYTVSTDGKKLYVYSSDVDYTTCYQLAEDSPSMQRLFDIAAGDSNYAAVEQNPRT